MTPFGYILFVVVTVVTFVVVIDIYTLDIKIGNYITFLRVINFDKIKTRLLNDNRINLTDFKILKLRLTFLLKCLLQIFNGN